MSLDESAQQRPIPHIPPVVRREVTRSTRVEHATHLDRPFQARIEVQAATAEQLRAALGDAWTEADEQVGTLVRAETDRAHHG